MLKSTMDLETKLAQLKQIYKRHDDFFDNRKMACRKFCASCCTCNVTMTTLEGYLVLSYLNKDARKDLLPSVQRIMSGQRFQPQVTINALATLYMRDQTVPEETSDPQWGCCPFLEKEVCTIYHVRPFGCRAMMSAKDCSQTGYAMMDEFALTVNNIFLQTIEHLDQDGLSGNLSDIIDFINSSPKFEAYLHNDQEPPASGLIRNQPIQMLMIPPEHRIQTESLLRSLGFLFEKPK